MLNDGASTSVKNVERVSYAGVVKTWAEFTNPTQIDGLRYAASYADLTVAFGPTLDAAGASAHYYAAGKAEGRASAYFDPLLYAASNADLALAFANDPVGATKHYLTQGYYENRSTNSFDALRYAASNVDLALAFGADIDAAAHHYLVAGQFEHRSTTSFDAYVYLTQYADVFAVTGQDTNAATRHYLTQGAIEGRAPSGLQPLYYAASYVDLAKSFGLDAHAAAVHFVTRSAEENRVISFDPKLYAASYVDLAQSIGLDVQASVEHYLTTGVYQDRAISGFDPLAYLLSYDDLAGKTPSQALDHWLSNGADEGRIGDALFGRETNDGNTVKVGSYTHLLFDTPTDYDYTVVNLAAGQTVQISETGWGSTSFHAGYGLLQVHDTTGHMVQTATGVLATDAPATITFTATEAGAYYIVSGLQVEPPSSSNWYYGISIQDVAPPAMQTHDLF